MGLLTNQYVSQSYQGLLNLENANTGVTSTLQYVTDGIGNKIPMQVSTSSVVITGSFRGDGSGLTGITANIDSGSLVTTSSFNAYTSSVNTKLAGLDVETGSLQLQINQKLNSSSFNSYTSSNDAIVNSLVNATGSYATTSSVTSLSQSIAITDLAQDNRLNSIESITGSFATTSSVNSLSQSIAVTDLNQNNVIAGLATTSSLTSLSQSIATTDLGQDVRLTALEGVTGSINRNGLITTGSMASIQAITGALALLGNVDIFNGNLNVYSPLARFSGSHVVITGSLNVTDGITGSLQGTASYATQALSASYAPSNPLPAGIVSGSQQIVDLGFATTSSVNSLSQSIAVTDLAQNNRLGSLETTTSSLQNQINQKLDTGSFNSYTSSNDAKVNSLINSTGSYVTETESGSFMTTGSVAGDTLTFTKGDGSQFSLQISVATGSLPAGVVSGSQQIVDLGFATTSSVNTKLDTGSFNTYSGNTLNLINTKLDSSSFNSYTSSNDGKVNDLISKTGSYATTGSNVFNGTQTISGSLNVTGEIVALSASITYLETIYQTSSVIFSSGSNILGDEASDVQTLNGRVDIPLGNLNITGSTTSSLGFFGNLQGTASFATNALSASYAPQDPLPAGVVSGSLQIVELGFATTSSVNTKLDTGSFNTYTGDTLNLINQKLDTGSFNSYTSSNDAKVNSLINATGSYVTETESGSFMITGSVSGATSTFTKGNGSQFSLTVNNVQSASHAINADTASFATSVVSSSYAENAGTASLAQDIFIVAKNTTGVQIDKGTVVRIGGSTGDQALIVTASWEDDNNSANTLGILPQNIANDASGSVITNGKLIGINTSGMTAGDLLYLSSSGQYTNVKPPAPYHEVRLGQVLRVQQNNGSMYVSIMNGYELEELHDVDITSPVSGDLLVYRSGSYGQWVNETGGELGFATTSSVNQKLDTGSFNTYTGDTLNLINTKLDTGSFNSYTSSNDAKVNDLISNTGSYVTETESGSFMVTGSVSGNVLTFTKGNGSTFNLSVDTGSVTPINTGSFATTGSNIFRGNQTITGSVNVTGSGIANTSGVNTQYFASPLGGNVGVFNNSNFTEIGLALDGAAWTTNWSKGPILYVNNTAGDTYEGVFGFQNKTNYTDGRITLLKNTDLSGSLIVTGGVTGSFRGDGSGLTGITATLPSGVVSGSQQITAFGFATTGSNVFRGNQTITGSVNVTGSGIVNTSGVNTQYLGSAFGGNMGVYNNSNSTEIGLALDGAAYTINWSNGPIMYVNNTAGDTYEGVFGFQNKANFTDGRITALKPMVFNSGSTVTGSFNVTGSSTLSGNNGFPLTVDGTINSKRLHFDKNPFNNDPSSNLGALRLDGNNQTFYLTNYDLADFANKQSVVGLFVNTGSNTANTYLESLFNGTSAKVELMNFSGSRTFRVDVDSSAITGSLTVSGGVTGSFSGDGSGLTGVTATLPNNVATTGSNTFIGNQTITGSVLVSGSATYDIDVVGSIRTSGPSTTILVSGSSGKSSIGQNTINIESSTNSPYLSTNFGGTVSVYDLSDSTEIGLSLDGSAFTGNWSNGPALYVNNTSGDTYDAVFGFQDKTNFTDGRVTVLKPINFNVGATGSFSGDGSGLTGITASAPNNVATTGSNNFKGNQTITGSVNVTGSGISNNSGVNTQYLYSAFGGGLGVYNNSNSTEIGLSLDGGAFTGNWSNGPALYVNNNPGDSYDGVFGFQNKANFTDGRITALKPMVFNSGATITGSLNVSGSGDHNIRGNNITVNGNTRMEGNNGFPLTVDGTISTKRFAFAGNPFNSNIGGTFGSLNYDGNNTVLQYVNGDFGTPQTSSFSYLTTDTGSNFTKVQNGAAYGGTTAETSLSNNNGVRTFNVNVDSTAITGSLTVSGGITGSLQGTASFATTASFALNGGGGAAFPFTGSAVITGSLGVTGSISTEMVTVDITSVTSGSVDLSLSNTFIVLDDNNPAGGHLTFTNHREGQQVTVLLNTNAGSQVITLTGAIRIVGAGTSITLNNAGYSIFQGVCYGGVFYGNFQSR
jgi:hypothetical protein